MANFKKVHYQDVWGESYIIEIDEQDIESHVNHGHSEAAAVLLSSYYPLLNLYTNKLIEDTDFAARFIADARKAVTTTGSFGDGFGGANKPEAILADQQVFLSLLNDLTQILEGTHPNVLSFGNEEELKKQFLFSQCQMILTTLPCWKVIGYEK